jgi:cell division septal protein FtsQ
MKKNKFNLPFSFPSIRIRFDKWTIIKLIAGLAVISLLIYGYSRLKGLEYFRVKEIILRQGSNISMEEDGDFAYLKGRSIFTIDLAREALNVSLTYPSYKKVKMTRFLPDRLFVDFLRRKPLACIKASRVFYIDENMVLFELSPDVAPKDADLPLISGIERKLFGAKYGRRIESEGLNLAMEIIKDSSSNAALKDYRISRVDVANISNAAIFILVPAAKSDYTKGKIPVPLTREMEIKVGQEGIANKLNLLATLLVQVRNNFVNITYIDLRFKEPVIKFRERT